MKIQDWQKALIFLLSFVVVFVVGVVLESKLVSLWPEILQSIGGIGVIVSAAFAGYKGFISK